MKTCQYVTNSEYRYLPYPETRGRWRPHYDPTEECCYYKDGICECEDNCPMKCTQPPEEILEFSEEEIVKKIQDKLNSDT